MMQASVTIPLPFIAALNERRAALLTLLVEAHQRSARDNGSASSTAAVVATEGSGTFLQGVIGALATTGHRHAPIGAARQVFLHADPAKVTEAARAGHMIPGFGSSFHKGVPDPAFQALAARLEAEFPEAHRRLWELEKALQEAGKAVRVNAAMYTAAACEICGVPAGLEPALFILARLPVWAELVGER